MKINNLLAFFSTFFISLTVQTLLKKSLVKKTKLTNKNSEYSEDKAKLYSKYLMGASCAKKPLKKTCTLCLKPGDGNEFVHFYLSKRSKLPFKLLIQYNDTMQKIFLFFSGPIFNKSNIQYFSKHFLGGNHLKNVKQYQGSSLNSEVYNVYFNKIKKKILKNLEKLIKSNRDEFGLVFVGNSVAGSLATLAAFDVKNNFEKAKDFKSFEVFAFNAFNFADDGFNKKLKASEIKFFRIFKENDFIISPNCSYNTANSKWKCSKVQDAALLQGDAAKDLNSTNSTLNTKNTTEAINSNNTTLNKNNNSNDSNHTDKASNRSFRLDEDFLFFLEEKNAFELKDEIEDNDYFNSENDNNEEFLNEELTSNEFRNEEENRMQAINNTITAISGNKTASPNTNLTLNMKNSSNLNSTQVSKLVRNHIVNLNYSDPTVGNKINATGIGNNVTQNGNKRVSNPKLVIKIDNKMRKNITIRINMNSTNGNRLGNKNNSMRKKGLLLNNTLISLNNASANNNSHNNASANNNSGNKDNSIREKGLLLNNTLISTNNSSDNNNNSHNNASANNNLNGSNTNSNLTRNVNNTSEINKTNHNTNFINTNNTNFNNHNDNSTHKNNSSSINHTSDSSNKTNSNNTDSANNRPHNISNTEGKHHKNNHTKKDKHGKNANSHKKNDKHNNHKHNSHHNKNPNHKKIKEYEKTENLGAETNKKNSNNNLISSSKCYANSIKTDSGSVLLRVDPGAYGEIIVYNKQMNKFESCTPEESKENDCKKCLINLVLERSINSYSHLDLFGKKLDSCKHK